MSVIAPTYLRGADGSVAVDSHLLPVTEWNATEEVTTFDATNALTQGYEWPEAATRKCSFTATAMWKKASGAPPFKAGAIYAVKLNTQQTSGGATPVYEGFSGNALISNIQTQNTVKGETKYTFQGQYQGVYDSPSYPTAIADAGGTPPTGDFAPPT